MKLYTSTGPVAAKPMTLRAFCSFNHQRLMGGQNPDKSGYLICLCIGQYAWMSEIDFAARYQEVTP